MTFIKIAYRKMDIGGFCKSCRSKKDQVYYSINRKEKEKSPERKFVKYRYSAKIKKLSFELSLEQFRNLFKGNCHYCGSDENIGIDRIDSNLGYVLQNCMSCCGVCNKMKLDYKTEFFIEHMIKILKHLKKI